MRINTKNKKYKSKQSGFTLVELMVSSVIGLITTAGVISVFANSMQSNSDNLSNIRLNQELRAIMDVMSRDIRRAGFWSDANGTNGLTNPFGNITIEQSGACILYSYDTTEDGTLETTDKYGFQLITANSVGSANLRTNDGTCDGTASANWQAISDPKAINITNIEFTINTDACRNATNSGRGCENAIANDQLVYMNVVAITLEGQLVNDSSVSEKMTKTIAVRNVTTKKVS